MYKTPARTVDDERFRTPGPVADPERHARSDTERRCCSGPAPTRCSGRTSGRHSRTWRERKPGNASSAGNRSNTRRSRRSPSPHRTGRRGSRPSSSTGRSSSSWVRRGTSPTGGAVKSNSRTTSTRMAGNTSNSFRTARRRPSSSRRRRVTSLIVFIVGHFGIDRPMSGGRTGTQLQ
jgi:hypothetical protein